jgi:hypothetical protein
MMNWKVFGRNVSWLNREIFLEGLRRTTQTLFKEAIVMAEISNEHLQNSAAPTSSVFRQYYPYTAGYCSLLQSAQGLKLEHILLVYDQS